jgi:mRNA interferase MazF
MADLRRGELYWVEWQPGRGSELLGRRPGLIVQTDAANRNPSYPNTIVAAVSTKGRSVPTHVRIDPSELNGLLAVSYVKCEQIMTIDKSRLGQRIGELTPVQMLSVEAAIRTALDLR